MASKTSRLVRRTFEEGDATLLTSWLSTDPLELFLTSSSLTFPPTEEEFLVYWRKNKAPDSHEFFSFVERTTGRHVGHCEMKGMSLRHGHGTIATVFIGREARGLGYGIEMLSMMLDFGFRDKGLHRVGLAVHTDNIPALATYVRAGFRFEGTIRDVLRYDNRFHSLAQMSVLDSEYARLVAVHSEDLVL